MDRHREGTRTVPPSSASGWWSAGIPLLTGLIVAGCARGGVIENPTPEPEPPLTVEFTAFDPEEEIEPDLAPELALLEEAEVHLSEGRFRRAAPLFHRYLARAEEPSDRHQNGEASHADRALWGLAMLHLLPESPLYDHEQAMEALDELAEGYGETVRGMQAKWIRGLLDELDQVRAQANQQEELLRQLTETVEQLKRIDLNRRPTGPGDTAVTGDTVPPVRDIRRRR